MNLRSITVAGMLTCLVVSPVQARHQHFHYQHHQHTVYNYDNGQIISHPAGCPWRAFCGCGASIEAFGHKIRELYLASNWFKFPHAAPAPGMAAVRNHHVMILRSYVGGDVWVVYDANSGGHQTRIHQRSISGYSIRDPHSGRYASNW